MLYNTGTVFQEKHATNEFLVLLGYSNLVEDDSPICSCLVVKPISDGMHAEVVGLKLIDEKSLVSVSRPEWADYINVSW